MYRVLIVDDEPMICKGLRSTIEWDGLGLEICGEARNGADALAIVRETLPNILITDIRMPVMDGITLIQTIRTLNIPIKIIILSGYSDYAFLKDAIRLGVDGYLLKPIDIDELISNLRDLVRTIENEIWRSTQLYQGVELLRLNTLNRLITNTIGPREFEEKAAFLEIPLEGECHLCAVCAVRGDAGGAAAYDEQAVQTVVQIAGAAIGARPGVAFPDARSFVVLLLSGDCGESLGAAADEALAAIALRVGERLGMQILAGRGCAVRSPEDIWRSYASAAESIGRFLESRETEIPDSRGNTVVSRALMYIADHYHEAISLKQLAGLFDVNTSYLGQIFRKATGESFTNYVNRTRVEKAKDLLQCTGLKVYEVAKEVGFTDYHYFLIIFKKITGTNPTDTRS